MPPDQSGKQQKPGYIARKLDAANQIRREPRAAVGLTRSWLLGLWQARGGGFYGLGFLVTFIGLEIQTIAGQLFSGDSVSEMVREQVFEFVFRFAGDSFINFILSFIWPVSLLDWMGAWCIPVLIAGYFVFERGLRPVVETWFPELRETRFNRQRMKEQKKQEKRIRKAKKKRR